MKSKIVPPSFLSNDIFGSKISLFFNSKEVDSTFFGILMTYFIYFIYIFLFLYFIIISLIEKNITLKEYEIIPDNPPSIKLSKEFFSIAFNLKNSETFEEFMDETIYTPKAYFKKVEQIENKWNISSKEIITEYCDFSNFGEEYKPFLKNNILANFYCISDIFQELEGRFNYENYSYFTIELFPCVNSSSNNYHCKSKDIINKILQKSMLNIQIETVSSNPYNYLNPVKPYIENIYTTVGNNFHRILDIYFQLIDIKTTRGFLFKTEKNTKKLKYVEKNQLYQEKIESQKDKNSNSFCEFNLKLDNKIKKQERNFISFFNIFVKIGGFTQCLMNLISFFSFLPISTIHELKIINKLFDYEETKNKDNRSIIKQNKTKPTKILYDSLLRSSIRDLKNDDNENTLLKLLNFSSSKKKKINLRKTKSLDSQFNKINKNSNNFTSFYSSGSFNEPRTNTQKQFPINNPLIEKVQSISSISKKSSIFSKNSFISRKEKKSVKTKTRSLSFFGKIHCKTINENDKKKEENITNLEINKILNVNKSKNLTSCFNPSNQNHESNNSDKKTEDIKFKNKIDLLNENDKNKDMVNKTQLNNYKNKLINEISKETFKRMSFDYKLCESHNKLIAEEASNIQIIYEPDNSVEFYFNNININNRTHTDIKERENQKSKKINSSSSISKKLKLNITKRCSKTPELMKKYKTIKQKESIKSLNKNSQAVDIDDKVTEKEEVLIKDISLNCFQTYFYRLFPKKIKARNISFLNESSSIYRENLDIIKIFQNGIILKLLIGKFVEIRSEDSSSVTSDKICINSNIDNNELGNDNTSYIKQISKHSMNSTVPKCIILKQSEN